MLTGATPLSPGPSPHSSPTSFQTKVPSPSVAPQNPPPHAASPPSCAAPSSPSSGPGARPSRACRALPPGEQVPAQAPAPRTSPLSRCPHSSVSLVVCLHLPPPPCLPWQSLRLLIPPSVGGDHWLREWRNQGGTLEQTDRNGSQPCSGVSISTDAEAGSHAQG